MNNNFLLDDVHTSHLNNKTLLTASTVPFPPPYDDARKKLPLQLFQTGLSPSCPPLALLALAACRSSQAGAVGQRYARCSLSVGSKGLHRDNFVVKHALSLLGKLLIFFFPSCTQSSSCFFNGKA